MGDMKEFLKQRKARAPEAKHGRLPDGSTFHVIYDAAKEEWVGGLTFHAAQVGGMVVLSDRASAVFKLLRKLDAQYREWAAKQEGGGDVGRV